MFNRKYLFLVQTLYLKFLLYQLYAKILSLNQVAGFFDYHYLWKKCVDISLIFCKGILTKGRQYPRLLHLVGRVQAHPTILKLTYTCKGSLWIVLGALTVIKNERSISFSVNISIFSTIQCTQFQAIEQNVLLSNKAAGFFDHHGNGNMGIISVLHRDSYQEQIVCKIHVDLVWPSLLSHAQTCLKL